MREDGPAVLLTGGSGGIGAAIHNRLVADGFTVISPGRSELNLSDAASVAQFLDKRADSFWGVVLCAGVNEPRSLHEITPELWARIQDVNLNANFAILSRLVPRMVEAGGGRVVAVSSEYATRARPGRSAYSVSKSGLEALVRSVAVEYASHLVLANSVRPGFIDTPLTRKNNDETALGAIRSRIPLGRLGTPEEVAHLVSFLLDSRTTYVTGQTFTADGGFASA